MQSQPSWPREIAGRYVLGPPLGNGGMGEVFAAQDRVSGATVAIKLLRASSTADQRRLIREARNTSALTHTNIVEVLDVGPFGGTFFYLVLELLRGETLASRLARSGVPLEDAYVWLDQLADALSTVHTQGFVHRDVKPANVFVLEGEHRIKLIDFGLSKALDLEDDVSDAGEIVGTPGYLAPEQLVGHSADARSDVHGFAVTAFELITGRPAFGERHIDQLVTSVLGRVPPAPGFFRAGVSGSVDAVVLRALSKAPEDRYASAVELLTAWREATASRAA